MSTETKSILWAEKVGYLPLYNATVVERDAHIEDCIKTMLEKHIGCLLVSDDTGALCGLFTGRDALNLYISTDLSGDVSIEDVMVKRPLTVSPTTTVGKAIQIFSENNIQHLPVCDEKKKIKGILNINLIANFLAEHFPYEVLNKPTEENIPTELDGG